MYTFFLKKTLVGCDGDYHDIGNWRWRSGSRVRCQVIIVRMLSNKNQKRGKDFLKKKELLKSLSTIRIEMCCVYARAFTFFSPPPLLSRSIYVLKK